MFVLPAGPLPASPADFAAALEGGLRYFVTGRAKMVTATGDSLTNLDQLAIDLSGAEIDLSQRPPEAKNSGERAIVARNFSVVAEPLSWRESKLALRLESEDAAFNLADAADGRRLLILNEVGRGKVEFEIGRADLERLLAQAAREQAAKQGVTIDRVKLEVRATDGRTLEAKVTVAARKIVFRATLNLSGTIAVDDNFVATFTNLQCAGEGAIASVACAALSAQFAKIERRSFPLTALPLGRARLRDLRVTAEAERVGARAEFAA